MRYQQRRLIPRLTSATPWPRLVTLIGLLAVMFMIISRAKDPHTWQWLTNESSAASDHEDTDPLESADNPNGDDGDPGSDGYVISSIETQGFDVRPTDLDSDELEAAQEEFQAISDHAPMLREEMPSYWRLMKWVQNQSTDELQRRARKAVVFTDFAEEPDKNRGKLVHLRLHVIRSLSYETPDSPIGIKRLYEAWGWSTESGPWLYSVVFPERPPGMPIGPDASAEISFDGYFLKLMSYEPRLSTAKPLFAPVLLGRVVWEPIETSTSSDANWFWISAGVGGVIILTIIMRWVLASRSDRQTRNTVVVQGDDEAIASWLQQSERDGS